MYLDHMYSVFFLDKLKIWILKAIIKKTEILNFGVKIENYQKYEMPLI